MRTFLRRLLVGYQKWVLTFEYFEEESSEAAAMRRGHTSHLLAEWANAHSIILKVDDEATLARVTDEEWEPVLYLPAEPSVALMMDALPTTVTIDSATGTFVSAAWRKELVLPLFSLVATLVTLQIAM